MHKNSEYRRRRTAFRLFSFLILLLAFGIALFFPISSVLVVNDAGTKRVIWHHQVSEGSTFGIRYIHSIHRTPVEEHYRIQSGQIVLTDLLFEDYGIGMESGLAPGEKLVMENGKLHVLNMNRVFSVIHLVIGQVRANHTLLFQGNEIPLGSVDKPGSAVTIQIKPQTIFNMIGGY